MTVAWALAIKKTVLLLDKYDIRRGWLSDACTKKTNSNGHQATSITNQYVRNRTFPAIWHPFSVFHPLAYIPFKFKIKSNNLISDTICSLAQQPFRIETVTAWNDNHHHLEGKYIHNKIIGDVYVCWTVKVWCCV